MQRKYLPPVKGKQKGDPYPGRHVDPDSWITGPDPFRHEIYYAWLKHKSQATFRKEDHTLSFEEWESLWTPELWEQRGRRVDDLCLQQILPGEGWHIHNVEIVTRRKHFADIKRRNQLAKQ